MSTIPPFVLLSPADSTPEVEHIRISLYWHLASISVASDIIDIWHDAYVRLSNSPLYEGILRLDIALKAEVLPYRVSAKQFEDRFQVKPRAALSSDELSSFALFRTTFDDKNYRREVYHAILIEGSEPKAAPHKKSNGYVPTVFSNGVPNAELAIVTDVLNPDSDPGERILKQFEAKQKLLKVAVQLSRQHPSMVAFFRAIHQVHMPQMLAGDEVLELVDTLGPQLGFSSEQIERFKQAKTPPAGASKGKQQTA